MGLRAAVGERLSFLDVLASFDTVYSVVCVASFLLGCLFTHWIADSLTLWRSPTTDDHLWTSASYYSILAKSPDYFFYALSAITSLGALTIIWSFRDGEAGNLMFDGGSICMSVYPSSRVLN
jgi:hypothetical protein